jgi:hypothetical protein
MSKEFYENGYGVSVVCNEYSYGGREGLYELAILKGDKDHSEICYVKIVLIGMKIQLLI